ncbi:uncharacterized protein LOC144658124 [Oculina patagonica]
MAAAAPTASSKETTNYARLCRLLVDVGTQALRDQFDAIHSPANLPTVLAANKTTLQSLRARKIINATQWGKLFPAIPSSVSSRDFDTTLLMVLLRNLCGLLPPATGWDTLPAVTDVSLEADIARVKFFRNTVYAHAEHASVDDATFNTYWQDIRDTLVRLGGVQYRAAIDNLETECMDPEIEDHYKDLLSQWKKDEENIKDELKEIGTEIRNVMKKLDDLAASSLTTRKESSEEGKRLKLEELVETSVMCREKQHENERLDYYCQNCKVCICDKCGQTRHTHHTKVDIEQAAEEQKLNLEELVQEMKLGIADHEEQIEKTTEFLRKSREKIAAARNNVLTTVEELFRVLKEHEIAIDTKLDVIEEQQKRDHATQLEHFQISVTQLKTSVEYCEAILQRNNSVEILEAQQRAIEKCKGILKATKMNIYKPLHVRYMTNEEDVQSVRRAILGEVFASTTDPLQSVAEGKGLKEAKVRRESSLTITITTKDSEGNRCYNQNDEIVVKVKNPSEEILEKKIEDNGTGEYSVTYTPDCHGQHEVVIEVNGQPLTSSPWSIHVAPHQYQYAASFGSRGKAQGKFDCPFYIAISDKTGNIAVADAKNHRVQLFSPDGVYLTEFGQKGPAAKKLNRPTSVAFNKFDGVTIIDDRGIFFFTETGKFIKNISNDHLIKPRSMTIAGDGRMVVCDCGDNKVKVLSPGGTELLQSVRAPDSDASPWSALYHQDMFYVSYGSAQCVKVFNSERVYLYDIGTEGSGKLNCPVGLAVDKFNNLIVCDTGKSRVQVFTLDGKLVNSIIESPVSPLEQPWAVAVSTTGQLFITDVEKHNVFVFE